MHLMPSTINNYYNYLVFKSELLNPVARALESKEEEKHYTFQEKSTEKIYSLFHLTVVTYNEWPFLCLRPISWSKEAKGGLYFYGWERVFYCLKKGT